MSSNSFGRFFRITTWGESHGVAMGVVIDGCPPNIPISEEEINQELLLRAPGQSLFTSPRQEKDECQILSGVYEGKTTGAPISLIIYNKGQKASDYEKIKNILRPGHANFTYLAKYGIYDPMGGGRASARETVSRVAASAVAKKIMSQHGIEIVAFLEQVGHLKIPHIPKDLQKLRKAKIESPLFCPDHHVTKEMESFLLALKEEGDSVGGIVSCISSNLPIGLGDPVFEKIEANLAKGMLSIPACKGFEIGEGFNAAYMKGSEHNDLFILTDKIDFLSNHAGGTLGGITNGQPLLCRVAFKPTSSIKKPQKSVNLDTLQPEDLSFSKESRHDPCVAIRAVAIVEAMASLVIADSILAQRTMAFPSDNDV